MADLWQCNVCSSVLPREQIDGKCRICDSLTCDNCKRTCNRCQNIVCMNHCEQKMMVRSEMVYSHVICDYCRDLVW